jgi:hypothetical protein
MPSDVAEVELVEAVLAARERQDHAVLRHGRREVGVIAPARLGAVAAADQEEVAIFPALTSSMTFRPRS